MSISNEADRTTDLNRLAGRSCVRLPKRNRGTLAILVVGLGAYFSALGLMWIMGSVLYSGIIAALGMALIVADLHFRDRARGGG